MKKRRPSKKNNVIRFLHHMKRAQKLNTYNGKSFFNGICTTTSYIVRNFKRQPTVTQTKDAKVTKSTKTLKRRRKIYACDRDDKFTR